MPGNEGSHHGGNVPITMGTFLTPTGTFLTPQGTYQEGLCCVVSLQHPGELATKVRYFGVKSTEVPRQMGT